jgi:uncharacterized protein
MRGGALGLWKYYPMRTPLVFAAALVLCSAVSAVDTPAPAPAPAGLPAPVVAATPPPSKESIDKLLVAMNVEKMIANMQAQVESAMKAGVDQSLRGQALSADQQKIVDALRVKISSELTSQLNWENMRPLYTQVYSETFTQEEINGLTAFYESPAGRAFVSKVPQVMKKTMTLMQARMGPVIRDLQQSIRESAQQVSDLKAKSAAAAAAPVPASGAPAAPAAKPAGQ